jgi:hypothetical protein
MMRRTLRTALVAIALGSVSASTLVATPAVAAAAEPVVITVPEQDRAHPRNTAILGESAEGVFLLSEQTPTGGQLRGDLTGLLIAPDGTESPSPIGYGTVVGDRVVSTPGNWPESITWHSAATTELHTTAIPSGTAYLSYTADGIVVHTSTGLAIAGWDDDSLRPISLPASYDQIQVRTSDTHGVVVTGRLGGTATSLYIDTVSAQSWTLPTDWAYKAALGSESIVWIENSTIAMVDRPSAGEQLGAMQHRTIPTVPAGGNLDASELGYLPVGENVIVFRNNLDVEQWGQTVTAPVYISRADGTTDVLLGWGHDVVAGLDGSFLAVGGATSADQAVLRFDGDSLTSTVVTERSTIRARVAAIAIDGNGLFIGDESSDYGGLVEFDLTDGQTTEVSRRYGSVPVAGDGSISWTSNTAPTFAIRDADGTTRRVSPSSTGLTQLSSHWALASNRRLINTTTGDTTYLANENVSLQNDVLYQPGSDWASAIDTVVARDLHSGQSEFLATPDGCAQVSTVQVAGSWMLLGCASSVPVEDFFYVVVDRTGASEPLRLPELEGEAFLGNGFLLVKTGTMLEWSPLDSFTPHAIATDVSLVARSRGDVPSIAWTDTSRRAFAAVLPVATSALPTKPTGVDHVPTAPAFTVTPGDGSVTLTWAAAAPGDEVRAFLVARSGSGAGRSVILPPTETSHTFSVPNGTAFTFSVRAQNARGTAGNPSVSATAMSPYPEYARISSAEFSVHTNQLVVAWNYTPAIGHDPVTSFDIVVEGETVVSALASTVRSATIPITAAAVRGKSVTLVAHGARDFQTHTTAIRSDEDLVAPTAAVTNLAEVTIGKTLTASVAATDDNAVASVDVRLRSSTGMSKAIGAWTYPATWQGVTGTFEVTKSALAGRSYCLSARATDAQGNQSGWSDQVCTAVAVDERALKKSGTWRVASSSKYFNGTTSRPATGTAALSAPVRANTVWIVATTCPTCGAVGLRVGNTTIKVDLRSSTKKYRQAIKVQWGANITGTVKIVRWGSSSAAVDGFAVLGR